jgi:hypothetical protein
LRQTAANVISQRHGAQEFLATSVLALGHRERRWHNPATLVRERRRVRVVGLVGMSEHAVREGGVDGGSEDFAADH